MSKLKESIVLDAGTVVSSFIPNEHRALLRERLRQWQRDETIFYAPSLWVYETTSTVSKLQHFKSLSPDDAQRTLRLIQKFPIHIIEPDISMIQAAFEWTNRLKRAAAYDSFYLVLARHLDCTLWTIDRRLVNAVN